MELLLATGILLFVDKVGRSLAQTSEFVRDCNDPLVVGHLATFGHTYCNHACGSSVSGQAVCDPGGFCICPCSPTGPQLTFDSFLCPPGPNEAVDTDPNALPECRALCASGCEGGQGEICSEITTFTNPSSGATIYGKLCVCICPPSSCTFSITTTTQASTAVQVYLLPNKKPKLLFKKILLKKTLFLCLFLILIKISFVKLTLVFLYILFYGFNNYDFEGMFENNEQLQNS